MSNARAEELILVFAIESGTTESINFGKEIIGRIEQTGGVRSITLLHLIAKVMKDFGPIFHPIMNGKLSTIESFVRKSIRNGTWGNDKTIGNLTFICGGNVKYNIICLFIKELIPGASISWMNWVRPFMDVHEFIHGWLADRDYQDWQTVEDPLIYQCAGRDYKHLPMIRRDLPSPLDVTIIDTSSNPGRWCMKQGYVQGIGQTMWFGERFWNILGLARKEQIINDPLFVKRYYPNNILEIHYKDPLYDEHTLLIQNHLRSALYD